MTYTMCQLSSPRHSMHTLRSAATRQALDQRDHRVIDHYARDLPCDHLSSECEKMLQGCLPQRGHKMVLVVQTRYPSRDRSRFLKTQLLSWMRQHSRGWAKLILN